MSKFRQRALDRISAVENLDEAVVVASPMHWLVACATILLVIVTVAWGFLGSIPTRVSADGILLRGDSAVFSASTDGAGELVGLKVGLGDRVIAGQVVALLDQHLERRLIEVSAENLAKMRDRLDAERSRHAEDRALADAILDKRRQSLRDKIANAEKRQVNHQALVDDMAGLLEKGYVQRTRVLTLRNELLAIGEEIAELKTALIDLEAEDMAAEEQWHDKLDRLQGEVERAELDFDQRSKKVAHDETIRAPIDGEVTEISAALGDVMSPGMPVVRIVGDAVSMEALLFVDPTKGKLIQLGLPVNVEPSVAKKEEFGTILADVQSISMLPLSGRAILAMLQNEELVQKFTANGPPIAVRVQLRASGEGARGYAWTGGSGPPFSIEHGTLVNATISVREQRPASLILPFLKSFLGV